MKFLSREKYSAPLSIEIAKAYNKLIESYNQVPSRLLKKREIVGTGGAVSVCNLIAYQIGWGTLLISWYEAGIKDEHITMPGHGFTSWDYVGLAQLFYKNYAFDCSNGQFKTFEDIVEKILAIVEKEAKKGNLDKENVWKWCTLKSGKQWPLSKWIKVNTSSPYKKAAHLIRSYCKNAAVND